MVGCGSGPLCMKRHDGLYGTLFGLTMPELEGNKDVEPKTVAD